MRTSLLVAALAVDDWIAVAVAVAEVMMVIVGVRGAMEQRTDLRSIQLLVAPPRMSSWRQQSGRPVRVQLPPTRLLACAGAPF